jgi:hypothetical protein
MGVFIQDLVRWLQVAGWIFQVAGLWLQVATGGAFALFMLLFLHRMGVLVKGGKSTDFTL